MPSARRTTSQLAKRIDHTLLRPTATPADFARLFDEAVEHRFWSVCVPSWMAGAAASRLKGTGVKVCAVVGFPLGSSSPAAKAFEAAKAIEDGADEVDMVMNVGAFKGGEVSLVEAEIGGVAAVCRANGALLKVIIECCYLTDVEKADAAKLSARSGADYVKTSTGFGTGGATVEDVALLRRALAGAARIKASGGVNTLAKALSMVAAGADRIGTSSGVSIMQELAGSKRGPRQGTSRKK